MEERDVIIKIYDKKEEINKIIKELKKYSFEDYIKTGHYEISLLTKGTDEDKLREIYPKFDIIELIALRRHKNGYENYDVYYELEKGNYALFAINLEGKKPKIDNAFIANRIFKNFLKSMVKRYGNKMV